MHSVTLIRSPLLSVVSTTLAAEIVQVLAPDVVANSPAPWLPTTLGSTIADKTLPVESQRYTPMHGAALAAVADSTPQSEAVIAPAIVTAATGSEYQAIVFPSVPAVAE